MFDLNQLLSQIHLPPTVLLLLVIAFLGIVLANQVRSHALQRVLKTVLEMGIVLGLLYLIFMR